MNFPLPYPSFLFIAILAAPSLAAAPAPTSSSASPQLIEPIAKAAEDVTVGPDGRLWLTLPPGNRPRPTTQPQTPVDSARESIAAAFALPMPKLENARPLLFEPSGRTWFTLGRFDRTLLAYDGKTFIEKSLPRTDPTSAGGPPALSAHPAARIDDTLFFAFNGAVYTFANGVWDAREFGIVHEFNPLHLLPEPDQKGLIVISADAAIFWRWRAGKWQNLLPKDAEPKPFDHTENLQMALTADGLWRLAGDKLTYLPFNGASVTVQQLLEQLKSDNFAAREKATAELIARGRTAEPDLRKALAENAQSELKYRLQYMINRLPPDPRFAPRPVPLSVPLSFPLGNVELSNPYFLVPLPEGGCLLGAGDVAPLNAPAADPSQPGARRPRTPGVVKINAAGTVTPFGDKSVLDLLANFRPAPPDRIPNLVTLLTPDHAALWFFAPQKKGASLLDLKTEKVIRTLLIALPTPKAATATALYVQDENALYRVNFAAKDDRLPLTPLELAPHVLRTAISNDGTLWLFLQKPYAADRNAQQPAIGFYNGKDVTLLPHAAPIPAISNEMTTAVSPAHDALLIHHADQWHLLTKTALYSKPTLEALIQSQPDAFIAAFTLSDRPGLPVNRRYTFPQIEIDNQKQIWLLASDADLKVLSHGKWIDAAPALTKNGTPPNYFQIVPVGDRSVTYVHLNNAPAASLLSLSDGKFSITPAPVTFIDFLPEPNGALWVQDRPDNEVAAGQPVKTVRLTEKGITRTIPNALPAAFDGSGNLWLLTPSTDKRLDRANQLRIFSNGKLIDIPESPLPGALHPIPGPGNTLYLRSTFALQQCTTSPGNVTLGPLFSLGTNPNFIGIFPPNIYFFDEKAARSISILTLPNQNP